MTTITDLLNKAKSKQEASSNGKNNQIENKPATQIANEDRNSNQSNSKNGQPARTGIKLAIGINKNKSTPANATAKNQIYSEKPDSSPFKNLAATLNSNSANGIPSVKSILGKNATSNETAQTARNAEISKVNQTAMDSSFTGRQGNFDNPTLEDVSKFVFKEQPDSSTEEITSKFSNMLDNLSQALGPEVPENLARCLKFMQQHAFLAKILKPEHIGDLVTAMRKSYGYIVKGQSEKQVKKSAKQEKENEILGDLSGLNF